GIYNFSRNPMYLGLSFVLTGFGLWLGNFAALFLVPCFVAYITRFQIIPEEEILHEKFGTEYVEYCERVGRWI
ncbi:MAG: isoprenylcysteine carboxylmethyltransferase family protein, partial [Pseudomonadota bacterium]